MVNFCYSSMTSNRNSLQVGQNNHKQLARIHKHCRKRRRNQDVFGCIFGANKPKNNNLESPVELPNGGSGELLQATIGTGPPFEIRYLYTLNTTTRSELPSDLTSNLSNDGYNNLDDNADDYDADIIANTPYFVKQINLNEVEIAIIVDIEDGPHGGDTVTHHLYCVIINLRRVDDVIIVNPVGIFLATVPIKRNLTAALGTIISNDSSLDSSSQINIQLPDSGVFDNNELSYNNMGEFNFFLGLRQNYEILYVDTIPFAFSIKRNLGLFYPFHTVHVKLVDIFS